MDYKKLSELRNTELINKKLELEKKPERVNVKLFFDKYGKAALKKGTQD